MKKVMLFIMTVCILSAFSVRAFGDEPREQPTESLINIANISIKNAVEAAQAIKFYQELKLQKEIAQKLNGDTKNEKKKKENAKIAKIYAEEFKKFLLKRNPTKFPKRDDYADISDYDAAFDVSWDRHVAEIRNDHLGHEYNPGKLINGDTFRDSVGNRLIVSDQYVEHLDHQIGLFGGVHAHPYWKDSEILNNVLIAYQNTGNEYFVFSKEEGMLSSDFYVHKVSLYEDSTFAYITNNALWMVLYELKGLYKPFALFIDQSNKKYGSVAFDAAALKKRLKNEVK